MRPSACLSVVGMPAPLLPPAQSVFTIRRRMRSASLSRTSRLHSAPTLLLSMTGTPEPPNPVLPDLPSLTRIIASSDSFAAVVRHAETTFPMTTAASPAPGISASLPGSTLREPVSSLSTPFPPAVADRWSSAPTVPTTMATDWSTVMTRTVLPAPPVAVVVAQVLRPMTFAPMPRLWERVFSLSTTPDPFWMARTPVTPTWVPTCGSPTPQPPVEPPPSRPADPQDPSMTRS